MGEVVLMGGVTRLDLPPERVLEAAITVGLTDAIVIGWDKEGELYFASSIAGGADVLWLLEKAKKELLDITG